MKNSSLIPDSTKKTYKKAEVILNLFISQQAVQNKYHLIYATKIIG